jgi:ABC-type transport system involved in Fe-S cluster assembly fused permease/ATPase subunit
MVFLYGIFSERTRVLLTSAAYVHLKHLNFSKHTRNLTPASRAILLSGPAGIRIVHERLIFSGFQLVFTNTSFYILKNFISKCSPKL